MWKTNRRRNLSQAGRLLFYKMSFNRLRVMNLHLTKEEFNKEIQRLNNRINFLCKHIAKQDKKINDLEIINKLVKLKYKKSNLIK